MAIVKKKNMIIEDEEKHPSATELIETIAELQLTNKSEGKILYIQGVKNAWSWRSMCFANQNFKAYYTLQLFNARLSLTKKAIEKVVDEGYVPLWFFKKLTTVASLGCGPGSDLCGLKAFLAESFPYSSRWKQPPTYTGYDAEMGWMKYLLELGFQFENREVNESFFNNMDKVDVILMSYCCNEISREFLRDRNGNCTLWKAVAQKAKFVLSIEHADSKVKGVLPSEKDGFEHFTLNDVLGNKAIVHFKFPAGH
ncbi:uncharacterized protein [Montipora capricornis]|uniref:uncharacterized protein n=1 Tax=Montipora foliosa TaxID=591990 RepID=UPI0035F191BE